MSRYRLCPTPGQEAGLVEHCRHARYVWNLAMEQHSCWRPGWRSAPGYVEQARQLTEARAEFEWLRAGSVTVQQQALRDFAHAMQNFFNRTHRRPTWRKAGQHEGFRQVAVRPEHIQRLNRQHGRVWVPKIGWVRFRLTRPVPDGVKSYRITRDRADRWHIAFAVIPASIPAPGNGAVVGVDRGIAVSAALSTGELLHAPGLTRGEQERLLRLRRRLARATRGSTRRSVIKMRIARLCARGKDRRKDWVEKTSTDIARRFDLIRVEFLNVRRMTRSARGTLDRPGRNVRQKAGLNRSILQNSWGLLAARLQQKASGRVEEVSAAYTSQTCAVCGHRAPESRKSQAVFRCVACGHRANADVNAAMNIAHSIALNIAAGRAVTARGDLGFSRSVKREPQPTPPIWTGR